MDEKNLNEISEELEIADEVEVVDETEAVDETEIVDEAEIVEVTETEENTEINDAAEIAEEAVEDLEEAPAQSVGFAKSTIIAGIAVIVAALILGAVYVPALNPYNWKYVDTTGQNIKELADMQGFTLSELKARFDFPFYMPATTSQNAAENSIKLKWILDQNDIDVEKYKELTGTTGDFDENTTMGEIYAMQPLSIVIGATDETIADFREMYGFGEEVTPDTLFGEVRTAIDKKTKADRIEAEKEPASTADDTTEE